MELLFVRLSFASGPPAEDDSFASGTPAEDDAIPTLEFAVEFELDAFELELALFELVVLSTSEAAAAAAPARAALDRLGRPAVLAVLAAAAAMRLRAARRACFSAAWRTREQ